jgi:hypothetical protein
VLQPGGTLKRCFVMTPMTNQMSLAEISKKMSGIDIAILSTHSDNGKIAKRDPPSPLAPCLAPRSAVAPA